MKYRLMFLVRGIVGEVLVEVGMYDNYHDALSRVEKEGGIYDYMIIDQRYVNLEKIGEKNV